MASIVAVQVEYSHILIVHMTWIEAHANSRHINLPRINQSKSYNQSLDRKYYTLKLIVIGSYKNMLYLV